MRQDRHHGVLGCHLYQCIGQVGIVDPGGCDKNRHLCNPRISSWARVSEVGCQKPSPAGDKNRHFSGTFRALSKTYARKRGALLYGSTVDSLGYILLQNKNVPIKSGGCIVY
jgi:hypothetical protein